MTFKNTATANGDVSAAELIFELDIHLYSAIVGENMLHTHATLPTGLLTGNSTNKFHVWLLWANKDSSTYDYAVTL